MAAAQSPPRVLERAVGLATADIDAAGPAGAVVSYEPSDEAHDAWEMIVIYAGEGSGFIVRASEDWPMLLAWVADSLQEAYIDTFWQARPRCPFHEHPLDATDDGGGSWVCPSGSGWQRPIGSLAGDAEYLAAIARPPTG